LLGLNSTNGKSDPVDVLLPERRLDYPEVEIEIEDVPEVQGIYRSNDGCPGVSFSDTPITTTESL